MILAYDPSIVSSFIVLAAGIAILNYENQYVRSFIGLSVSVYILTVLECI
jgi:hypothetical protein